jgi:glutamate dehydrogenase (NAD(P)+)
MYQQRGSAWKISCGLEMPQAGMPGVPRQDHRRMANGPTTLERSDPARQRSYVIPDFLCNAGGVTVSYFEMVQNAYDYYWDECVVHERLEKKMTAAFWAVHNTAQQHKVHNRLGAYLVAVNRVAEAVRLRGWA